MCLPRYVSSPLQHTLKRPESPSTITLRTSPFVGATQCTILSPLLIRWRTHSAPALVLPQPRPAKATHVFHVPSGSSCSGLAQNPQSCLSSSAFFGPRSDNNLATSSSGSPLRTSAVIFACACICVLAE